MDTEVGILARLTGYALLSATLILGVLSTGTYPSSSVPSLLYAQSFSSLLVVFGSVLIMLGVAKPTRRPKIQNPRIQSAKTPLAAIQASAGLPLVIGGVMGYTFTLFGGVAYWFTTPGVLSVTTGVILLVTVISRSVLHHHDTMMHRQECTITSQSSTDRADK